MRFNPPPQWPQPPAGWTPPPGWQPDPTWPPMPPGWQLWVEDTPAAPGYVPAGYGAPAVYSAPTGLPQYAQPQYTQPQYAQANYFSPMPQRSHRTFWIVFGVINALCLLLVIAVASVSPDAATCAARNLNAADCTKQQQAWIGMIIIWIVVELILLGVWSFRRRAR